MLQILQHLGTGRTELAEVPAPGPQAGRVLIQATHSLVSLGTERMLVEFGRGNWFQKARQQPERVREVWRKIQADGWLATFQAIRSKLAQPIPLGYCHVGQVVDSGSVTAFPLGCRVVSNGPHAEVVAVSPAFVVRVPAAVTSEDAAFTPLAAIAWQGIRLMDVTAGDRVVVSGLGLIGQLAVRLLVAQGCEVYGLDPDADKCLMAEQCGARTFVLQPGVDPVPLVLAWSSGQGVAGVLITATTASSEPVNQAARCCRRHGKVILVGVVGLQLNRADFYRQEVSFQVSNSYGTAQANDPHSAQANFQAVLELMAQGRFSTEGLISGRHAFVDTVAAYAGLRQKGTLGVLLAYADKSASLSREIILCPPAACPLALAVGLIGAGNFTARTLVPALRALNPAPAIACVVSARGASALTVARTAAAARVSTDVASVWQDPTIRAVFLATRHHLHVAQTLAALRAGKAVWVEKPLALNEAELDTLAAAFADTKQVVTVGFNRRFAPLAVHTRRRLSQLAGPKHFEVTVNAGALPADHWTLDPHVGGGRIVGEVCHFVDLCRYWAAAPIASVHATYRGTDGQDAGRFTLAFANGDTAAIHYLTDLDRSVPKEFFRITGEGWQLEIDNWVRCRGRGVAGFNRGGFWPSTPDKGHHAALQAGILTYLKSDPQSYYANKQC